MRIVLASLLVLTVALLPPSGFAQEEEEDDEGNDSFEQSTEDSSDATTAESTNEPSRNTTDPTVELLPFLDGEPTESEGDHTDRDRAAALGIAGLTLTLVIVAIISIAASPSRGRDPAPAAAPHQQRAAAWLTENDEQLRIDLARGHGPTLDDLAAAFALHPERRPAFGLALRASRSTLLAALDAPAKEPAEKVARVQGFLREVGTAMRESETTRPDWENWRRTYGVAVAP